MDKRVMTVLGAVAPDELGIVDGHSHVWIDPVLDAAPDAPVLNNETAIAAELRQFRAAGGGAIVDHQPGGCGRNGRILPTLSRASGVHLIASTGFHRKIYYPPGHLLWHMDAGAAADLFVDELTVALHETKESVPPVRAGVIKIAGETTLAETPQQLLEAAAIACLKTDCAISMHTERGTAVEDFLRFFLDQGVDPQRLIFCHVDKRPDFAFHQAIAQTGARLEYDTFFRPKYEPERNVWPLLEKMIQAGLAAQIILATDMADSGMWRTMGGRPGAAAFMTELKTRLETMAVPAAAIQDLMGRNVSFRLARPLPDEENFS